MIIRAEDVRYPRSMACNSGPGPAPDRRLPGVRELVGVGGVVASLSVTSDLTRGHPPGEAMRACLLATELARRAGLDLIRQSEVYYGTLLRFVGCAATSHEIAAALGGDDVAVRAAGDLIDPTVPGEAQRFLAGLGVSASQLRALGGPAGSHRVQRGTPRPVTEGIGMEDRFGARLDHVLLGNRILCGELGLLEVQAARMYSLIRSSGQVFGGSGERGSALPCRDGRTRCSASVTRWPMYLCSPSTPTAYPATTRSRASTSSKPSAPATGPRLAHKNPRRCRESRPSCVRATAGLNGTQLDLSPPPRSGYTSMTCGNVGSRGRLHGSRTRTADRGRSGPPSR